MFGSSIKLDKDLLKKIKMYAKIGGYSSAEDRQTRFNWPTT